MENTFDLGSQVGRVIRRFREIQGLSQAELAERAGVSQAAVSMTENGKRLNGLATLERICEALGLKLSRLFSMVEKGRTPDAVRAEIRRLSGE